MENKNGEVVKRPKDVIDEEYKRVALNFGDREYKIKCLKHALQPLERDAAMLFERMNQMNQEVARDYPEALNQAQGVLPAEAEALPETA